MRKRRHALSGAMYEVGSDGNVYVEKDGRRGVFTPRGPVHLGRPVLRPTRTCACGWPVRRFPAGRT